MINILQFRLVIPCLLVLCLSACEENSTQQELTILSGLTMGTTFTVKIHSPETNPDKVALTNEINHRLEHINMQMSTYLGTSTLSLFNQSGSTEWQDVPEELYTVIKEALRISKLSDNAFDVTIGPVVNLWGFGPETPSTTIPDESIIQETLAKVGSQNIALNSETSSIRKNHPDLYIDLSAIAKGYAVDAIANYLDELNINNYMVEIGGEIKTKGINHEQEIWHIGIEKPVDDKRTVQTIITLNNTGMATSGDYRNYFEENGIRYSHTIDPTTGKPITHKLASVTVLDPSAMTADALATALLVLGPEQGFNLALSENIAALFLVRAGNNFIEKMTPQFEPYLANPE